MAATKPSLRITKEMPYRGGTIQFSNRYYFNGGTPSSSANWQALFDAVVNLEKTMFDGSVTIVAANGYLPGSEVSVASKSYTTTGTGSFTGSYVPGDCAAVLRMATDKRSSKNHTVYVFSYFHRCLRKSGDTTGDLLDLGQKTAMTTYAAGWRTGITAGGITASRCTPDGHDVTGEVVDEYIGHRDFPR